MSAPSAPTRSAHRALLLAALPLLSGLLSSCSAATQALGSAVPLGAAAVELATNRPSFTDADEARMAQENARAFEAENAMWDDPLVETYLTDITQRLVGVAREAGRDRGFTYRIRVVRDASVNAFTFGGGLLYVHAGLIARMENEAQLAMVLGHELAHVTERHIPGGIERAFGLQVLGQIGATAASATGVLGGEALGKTYEYTMLAAVNGHGRGQESEADEVGIDYMVEAGYDPREAPRTFQKLLEEYGDQAPVVNFFYGSHPSNVSRFETLSGLAETRYAGDLAARTLTVNTEEFKRRTREIVVATGVLDYESKRFNTARAMFEKALPVSEGDPIPHYYLGKIALETGGAADVDGAVGHLVAATEEDPAFAPAQRELGLAYYRKRDTPRAVAAFRKYLELDPQAEDAARVQQMIAELQRP